MQIIYSGLSVISIEIGRSGGDTRSVKAKTTSGNYRRGKSEDVMQLLKFFFTEDAIEPPYTVQPLRDPLSHPDVARMSMVELADLPMGAEASDSHRAKQQGVADGDIILVWRA